MLSLSARNFSDRQDVNINININPPGRTRDNSEPSIDFSQELEFERDYYMLIRDLSTQVKFPIKSIKELDEQIGQVKLANKAARIKDVTPHLDCGEESYYPISDKVDFYIKAGRLLETKGFKGYFLSYSPQAIK